MERTGDDGAEFATESDSETFDAVVRPCRATGVLSVGGTGRLQAGRLYAVEGPTRALVQSDDCVDLPATVDDAFPSESFNAHPDGFEVEDTDKPHPQRAKSSD